MKIVQFANILSFAIVASQPFFYLLAMSRAQKELGASAYVELRNLLDRNLRVSLPVVYLTALTTSILFGLYAIRSTSHLLMFTSLASLAALLTDVYFMLTGDVPINKTIQTWTPDKYPAGWKKYRDEWFRYYRIRQVAVISGFLCVLARAIFE